MFKFDEKSAIALKIKLNMHMNLKLYMHANILFSSSVMHATCALFDFTNNYFLKAFPTLYNLIKFHIIQAL